MTEVIKLVDKDMETGIINALNTISYWGFSGGSDGKKSIYNARDLDSIPGLGRSPGEGTGLPAPGFWPGEFNGLYSPWGSKELDTTERLSLHFSLDIRLLAQSFIFDPQQMCCP